MKALLNLFVESAASDQATYSEWNNMSDVNWTATSEQGWRRKEPMPRRDCKQSTQAKQLTVRNKNALAHVTIQENKITPNRTFSLFCKSYWVLFLTFIIALRFYAAPPQV